MDKDTNLQRASAFSFRGFVEANERGKARAQGEVLGGGPCGFCRLVCVVGLSAALMKPLRKLVVILFFALKPQSFA